MSVDKVLAQIVLRSVVEILGSKTKLIYLSIDNVTNINLMLLNSLHCCSVQSCSQRLRRQKAEGRRQRRDVRRNPHKWMRGDLTRTHWTSRQAVSVRIFLGSPRRWEWGATTFWQRENKFLPSAFCPLPSAFLRWWRIGLIAPTGRVKASKFYTLRTPWIKLRCFCLN